MSSPLILIANPGSASRKYALFGGNTERARLHFEWIDTTIHCTLTTSSKQEVSVEIDSLDDALAAVMPILRSYKILRDDEHIQFIGLRVVAPGSYFLEDHKVDNTFIKHLERAKEHAPLHVTATLTELTFLRDFFKDCSTFAISDSTFHSTKPDRAWNYGLSLELADAHDIKRFGYHGLSALSVLGQIPSTKKLIICHLGSGASVMAVQDGKSMDTTMGFSPLEGVIMSTRSGSVDLGAINILKNILHYDDVAIEKYLNEESGLLGLGGSSDIRELLEQESRPDQKAHLALETYVYSIQKAIGTMAAALNGADALVFTGTVGERSAPIRKRITEQLEYLGFSLHEAVNVKEIAPSAVTSIQDSSSKPVYVVPVHEEKIIAERVKQISKAA